MTATLHNTTQHSNYTTQLHCTTPPHNNTTTLHNMTTTVHSNTTQQHNYTTQQLHYTTTLHNYTIQHDNYTAQQQAAGWFSCCCGLLICLMLSQKTGRFAGGWMIWVTASFTCLMGWQVGQGLAKLSAGTP